MISIAIPLLGAFEAWRSAARRLLAARVAPADIIWRREGGDAPLFAEGLEQLEPRNPSGLVVPKSFMSLAQTLTCSSDDKAFALLYRLLVRNQEDRQLFSRLADRDVQQAAAFEKDIRRDTHKMKAFVRFKDAGQTGGGRRNFASWFEPDHFIVERGAPFFARRFADMDWVIATPKGVARFVAGVLSFGPPDVQPPLHEDQMDEMWRAYYANIFNPARLKVKAMKAEMPVKYWKNLPEAGLIPQLIATAEIRAREMREKSPTPAPQHLAKFKASIIKKSDDPQHYESLESVRAALGGCERCPLHVKATQVVAGEGPATARIAFVGEQPGDLEDLQGRPFVGPAGQLLIQTLTKAGISRSDVYLTNAVKHFKFTPRGKRRLHERPNAGEVRHCSWWLQHELDILKPRLIVALGSTALLALTGDGEGVTKRRGKTEMLGGGTPMLVTYHPSAILRAPSPDAQRRMQQDFESDINIVAQIKARISETHSGIAPSSGRP